MLNYKVLLTRGVIFLLHFLLKALASIPSIDKINGLKKRVLYKCFERGQRKKPHVFIYTL